MNAELIKKSTLSIAVAQLFIEGKVRTQDDIVEVARVVMTDLEVPYKEALEFISGIQKKISDIQEALLAA